MRIPGLLGALVMVGAGIGAVCGLGAAAESALADPPPVGSPVLLDHGYRYDYEVIGAQTASIALSDSCALLAWGEGAGHQVMGRLFGLNGETLGDSTVVPIGFGNHFDLSSPDAAGWKMAAQDGQFGWGSQAVCVRNLDPRTLAITAERTLAVSTDASALSVTMERFGNLHTVCWVEAAWPAYRLRLTQVDVDLQPLQRLPLVLPVAPGEWTIDLAAGPGGGLLAFIDDTGQATVLPLGPEGLPAGEPIALGLTGTEFPMVAVRPWGDGWIAAWSGPEGILVAFLDSAGAVLPPGAFSIEAYASAGLAPVEGPDGTGLLCWRQGYAGADGIYVTRIAPGVGPTGEPISLDTDSPYQQHSGIQDPRDLTAVWTGSRFAVLWVSFRSTGDQFRLEGAEPPRTDGSLLPHAGASHLRREEGSLPDRTQRPLMSPYGKYPARLSWLTGDGVALDPAPRVASRGTLPVEVTLQTTSGGVLAVGRERDIDEYLHVFRLDANGQPAGPAERLASFAPVDSCGPYVCFYHDLDNLAARPCSGGSAVGYACHDYRWSSGEIHEDEYRIAIDRFAATGLPRGRAAFEPGFGVWDDLLSFDFAMFQDSALVFCVTDDSWLTPGSNRGWVELVGPDGTILRTWQLAQTGWITAPALAPLSGGRTFLLVWGDEYVPQSALLDLDAPGVLITGDPFLTGLGELRGRPRVLPGPAQFLAVLPMWAGQQTRVYAARFDASGAPVAASPSLVFQSAGDQWRPDGAWDGFQYLVASASLDGQSLTLLGNRVGTDGTVYDGGGFEIDRLTGAAVSVSTDGLGRCLVAYDGNHVRTIDDPGILSGVEGDGSTAGALSGFSTLRFVPNPTTSGVRLARAPSTPAPEGLFRVLDSAGRDVIAPRPVSGEGSDGRDVTWDGRIAGGRRAPSGIYFLRIERNGSAAAGRVLVLH